MARLVAALVRRPFLWVAVILVATAGALWVAKDIEIRSDMEDLFPEHTPTVRRAREAREIVGSRSELTVLLGGDDAEVNRQVAGELAQAFAKHTELVGSVEYRRETAFFERNALLYMSLEDLGKLQGEVSEVIAAAVAKEMDGEDDFGADDEPEAGSAAGTPEAKKKIPTEEELRERYGAEQLREYYDTPDGTVLAVKVYPTFKPAQTGKTRDLNQRIAADIDAALARHPGKGLSTALEGDYAHVTAAVDQIRDEGMLALIIALAGISAVLIVYFRRARAVLNTLVPLVVGLIWTFFLARVFIGYLNLITAFIFSILVGLGIDFVVHGASRADEAMRAGTPLSEALPQALSRLGRAMLSAALTTSATFLALMVFDFRGFSQFGLIAGLGVLVCLGSVYLVYPPLEAGSDRLWKRGAAKPRTAAAARARRALGPRAAWGLVVLFLAAAAVAGSWLPALTFEADTRKLRSKSTRVTSELKKKYSAEGDTSRSSPALFITADLVQTEALQRHLEGLVDSEPLLDEVRSIFSFVPAEQPAKALIVKEIKRKVDNKYNVLEGEDKTNADSLRKYLTPEPFGPEGLPGWIKERFTDTRGQLGRYVLMYINGPKSDAAHVVEVQERLGSVTLDGQVYYATASWFILGDAYTVVQQEGPWAVGLASLVVLLFLLFDFRGDARDIATVFVPLMIGFVIFLGVLALAEIPLNIFNIVVLPTIFGIGVDTSIHLVHRLNQGEGIGRTLATTGGAAAVSSLTTAIGFLALTFVSNQGLQSIGTVAVIGIAVSYLTSVALIGAFAVLGFKRLPAPSA